MAHLVIIILTLPFCISGTFLMYHTNRETPSDYDCIYYTYSIGHGSTWVQQLMPYCLRPSILGEKPPLSDHPHLTFTALKKQGISSANLVDWLAPIDVAEDYEIFLRAANESHPFSTNLYFNCSSEETGRQCEYYFYFDYNQVFSVMVQDIFLIKNQEYKPASTVPCYIHLSCIRGTKPLCLDWREICDGKKDCANGEDEVDCWQLEANKCGKNEYQCHSGHCIPDSLLRDETYSPDCMDGSDEPDLKYDDCAHDPKFRCEEHTCYSSINDRHFECGDGQCIRDLEKCANKREDSPQPDEYSPKGNLSSDCWMAMACLTGYLLDTEDKECGYFCWGQCAQKIIDHCPQYFRFPDHTVAFDHVHFIYARDTADVKNDLMSTPMFLCYDVDKCVSDLQSSSYILGQPCLHYDKLNVTFNNLTHWNQKVTIIAGVFRSMCENMPVPFQCPDVKLYRCAHTEKCISIRRLVDGIIDCPEGDDETFGDSCSLEDSATRFQCSQENKCLSPRMVNNKKINCQGADDEFHPHQRISQHVITFGTICDGFQELQPILIDGKNETDETDCEHWPCNNIYTHCDDIWNCKDGADEIGCLDHSLACPSLHHHCVNRTTGQMTCLPLSKANDGEIDCLGGLDEIWQCQSLTRDDCFYQWQNPYNCYYQSVQIGLRCWSESKCSSINDCFQNRRPCLSGEKEKKLLCDNIGSKCSSAHSNNLTDAQKLLCSAQKPHIKWSYRHFQISKSLSSTELSKPSSSLSHDRRKRQFSNSTDIWPCHRGIPAVVHYNRNGTSKTKCLCPPSYFGDSCEYQNERISLSVQIQMLAEWKVVFTFVYFLINDRDEIESHDQIHYSSAAYCGLKVNRYLLFSSRPRNMNRSYSVRVEAYDRQKLEYRASWRFSLPFAFLPVQRLAIQLRVPVRRTQCFLDCGSHGQCSSFINTGERFCRCDSGWTGEKCELPQEITCSCAPDSLCRFGRICVCPLGRHGQRCYLPVTTCSPFSCKNNGICIQTEPRAENDDTDNTCLCPNGFYGTWCESVSTQVTISFHNTAIPSLIFLHFIQVVKGEEHQRIDSFKKIPIDQESASIYISFDYQILFVGFHGSYYLAYLQRVDSAKPTKITLHPHDRCLPISQIFSETFVALHLLRRIKYYHKPCQIDHKLQCFYDEQHMCLCDDERRANCLTFNHSKTYTCQDNYGDCENRAQCFHDRGECPLSTACLCPECYYGSRCQFSTYGLGLSLDAILGYHIQPNKAIASQSMYVKVSIALVTIILVLGTINSLLSILTFLGKQTRSVGCGIYLLGASFSSLLSVWSLTCKFLFLLLAQMQLVNNRSFLLIQCVCLDFFLQVFLSFGDWLIACVALERAVAVTRGIHFDQSKSQRAAKMVCYILFLFTACTIIHDPSHRRLLDDEEEQRTWCIVRYSATFQTFNSIIRLFHFIVPFTINLISVLVIIIAIARSRTAAHKQGSFKQHLIKQLRDRKNLLISPIVLTILAVPRLIIAIFSGCMVSARDPTLFLFGYFTSIIPAMLTFIIFVLASKAYKEAFLESARKYFV